MATTRRRTNRSFRRKSVDFLVRLRIHIKLFWIHMSRCQKWIDRVDTFRISLHRKSKAGRRNWRFRDVNWIRCCRKFVRPNCCCCRRRCCCWCCWPHSSVQSILREVDSSGRDVAHVRRGCRKARCCRRFERRRRWRRCLGRRWWGKTVLVCKESVLNGVLMIFVILPPKVFERKQRRSEKIVSIVVVVVVGWGPNFRISIEPGGSSDFRQGLCRRGSWIYSWIGGKCINW